MNNDWFERSLEDVAVVTMGSSPSSASYNQEKVGLPLVQGNADIKNRIAVPRVYTSDITKEADQDDLLMTVRAPVGFVAKLDQKVCLGRGVCSIKPKNIDRDYLYYYLIALENKWKSIEQGSTFTAVNSRDVKGLKIKFPSKLEQEKIAEVLSTADLKIGLVEQKIIQNNALKKGLMQKLFSLGIGVKDKGNWLPHKAYKVSPLGQVPLSWQIVTIDELGAIVEDGDRGKEYPKQEDLSDEGYCLFLNAKNVTKSGLDFTKLQFITESKDNKLRKGKVLNNDIVITTRGSVGHVGYFQDLNDYESVRINSGMAIIRTEYSRYLNVFMMSSLFKKQVNKMAFGSAQPQLTIKNIKNFRVAIPSSNEEMEQITAVILNMDDKLRLLYQQKLRLEELKKGLMQKLLTGLWSVNSNSSM